MSRFGARLGLVVLVTWWSAPGAARAQVPDAPPPDAAAVLLGPVKLWPLFVGGVELNSNLFQVPEIEGGSEEPVTVSTAAPGLLAELPFSNSLGRVGYVGSYRDYGSSGIESGWTHHLRADLRLLFGSGVVVEAGEDFSDGILDTRIIDPGGDLTFQGEDFRRSITEVSFGHSRPERRSIFFRASHAYRESTGERISGLYDTVEDRLTLDGERRVSTDTWISWSVAATDAELSRPSSEGDDRKAVRGLLLFVGGRGRIGATGNWNLLLGPADYQFEGGERSRYRGPVVEGTYGVQTPGGPRLSIRAARIPYALLSDSGDFYVSSQASVRFESAYEARLVAGAGLAYYGNVYPTLESRREDRLYEGDVWAGYRFRNWIEWRVFVRSARRDSTEPLVEYRDVRVGTALRVGG